MISLIWNTLDSFMSLKLNFDGITITYWNLTIGIFGLGVIFGIWHNLNE